MEYSRNFIFKNHKHHNTQSVYNFPMVGDNWRTELLKALDTVKDATADVAKVNITMGTVLKDKRDDELRYFTPGDNFPLFSHPYRIHRFSHWGDLFEKVSEVDINSSIQKSRPNTKWELLLVTNARIEISYPNVNMGGIPSLPEYLKSLHCIRGLTHRLHDPYEAYDDNNCAVRALAYHRLSGNDPNISSAPPQRPTDGELDNMTENLRDQWAKDGLDSTEIDEFEECFDIDVDVFNLLPDNTATPVYLSEGKRGIKNRLTLNLYKNHLSYVSNRKAYLLKYCCDGCGRCFDRFCI